jgi:predicted DNA-binding transcriptional regulator AlpA
MATTARSAPPTLDEIKTWPAVVDLVTGGAAFGLGRNKSYELAKAGQFPVPAIKIGATYRVVTSEILAVLDPQSTSATTSAA